MAISPRLAIRMAENGTGTADSSLRFDGKDHSVASWGYRWHWSGCMEGYALG